MRVLQSRPLTFGRRSNATPTLVSYTSAAQVAAQLRQREAT